MLNLAKGKLLDLLWGLVVLLYFPIHGINYYLWFFVIGIWRKFHIQVSKWVFCSMAPLDNDRKKIIIPSWYWYSGSFQCSLILSDLAEDTLKPTQDKWPLYLVWGVCFPPPHLSWGILCYPLYQDVAWYPGWINYSIHQLVKVRGPSPSSLLLFIPFSFFVIETVHDLVYFVVALDKVLVGDWWTRRHAIHFQCQSI